MNITELYKSKDGTTDYMFEYRDADNFEHLEYEKCRQVYGICFCNNLLVIGYNGHKKHWSLIGGTIEKGETFEQTLRREVKEESNMKVLSFKPIGYQKVIYLKDKSFIYQLRYACVVEPFGNFISDPSGSVTEIKLVSPSDYKKYFDWGDIGDRIVSRAVEIMQP